MRFEANVQYPADKDLCKQSMLLFNKATAIHPGWAGCLGSYAVAALTNPYAVVGTYVSISNDLTDVTAFIDGKDCPHEKNKWLCAFNPTTSCKLPKILTECNSENCVDTMFEPPMYFSIAFEQATEDAKPWPPRKPDDEEDFQSHRQGMLQPRNDEQKRLYESIDRESQYRILLSRYELTHYLAHDHIFYKKDNEGKLANQLWLDFPKGKGSIEHWQNNSILYLREQMSEGGIKSNHSHFEHIHTIYDRLTALPHGRCVAAHIRRGDRIPRNDRGETINGTDYCQNNPTDFEKGCAYAWSIPFFQVTLLDYLRKAETLVDPHQVHYLFVNTDERRWLSQCVKEYYAMSHDKHGMHGNWTIFYFP